MNIVQTHLLFNVLLQIRFKIVLLLILKHFNIVLKEKKNFVMYHFCYVLQKHAL